MRAPRAFIFLSSVGVGEAIYHAWLENAFTTNWYSVSFSSSASLLGIPYWVFGVVWFPAVLVVTVLTTRYGREALNSKMLTFLSIGNIFTVYLWYLDFFVVGALAAPYVGLYVTNYALTGLVVLQGWSTPTMKDFAAGTLLGMVIGVFFGPLGVAALGVSGGVFGAIAGYTSTR